jgi:hypothetical protein
LCCLHCHPGRGVSRDPGPRNTSRRNECVPGSRIGSLRLPSGMTVCDWKFTRPGREERLMTAGPPPSPAPA